MSQATGTSKISIQRLRDLKERADQLLNHVMRDLQAFLHEDRRTFLRKPDSKSYSDDVNVTTTCSCLMALTSTHKFHDFYDSVKEPTPQNDRAQSIFKDVVDAPWMSSGLMSNNAFTTSLVLRTYGFLVQNKLFDNGHFEKRWDLGLELKDDSDLADKLCKQDTEIAKFLFRSLSDKTRSRLSDSPSKMDSHDLEADLRRIIHNAGWIYEAKRFPDVTRESVQEIATNLSVHKLVQFNRWLILDSFKDDIDDLGPCSLLNIAKRMAKDPGHFRINEYEPAAPVVYWFVDGVRRAGFRITGGAWDPLCEWATNEFHRQRSLVLAKHDAMMDPVAMGMAACLCARLRKLINDPIARIDPSRGATLPSTTELEHSIQEMFAQQTNSGIWPKYFPMFHYQEAGSNFCFTFELLEAVLNEFDEETYDLLNQPDVINGLEKAISWCEKQRLETSYENKQFRGWNSGGDLRTLVKEQPESWATAVVHMFLRELSEVLSGQIQTRLLKKYGAVQAENTSQENITLDKLLDINILIQGEIRSLKNEILLGELIGANKDRCEQVVRDFGVRSPMSALLFGPPGTSKTRLTEAISDALGWPLIVINPSTFVEGSIAEVYARAAEVFRDLDDLSAVVVFFDEVDPLMQSREAKRLDTATQFLTTSMLPRLTQLHGRRRVVYLMATNHKDWFDPALIRAGRFDLLLCMGPPSFKEKIERISVFLEKRLGDFSDVQREEQIEGIKERLTKLAPERSKAYWQLELLTFDEFKGFLGLWPGTDIGEKLKEISKDEFTARLRIYSKDVRLRLQDLAQYACPEYASDRFDLYDIAVPAGGRDEEPPPIASYLRDRKESKKQY